MVAPNFKRASDTTAGTASIYGAPDIRYAFDVVDGTHATDRIQGWAIEHNILNYDVVVYVSGSTIYARTSDGALLSQGAYNTSENFTVLQAAFDYAHTVHPRPITIVVKPGVYNMVGNTILRIRSNTTLIGYGATFKSTVYGIQMLRGEIEATYGLENIKIFGMTFDFNNVGNFVVFIGTVALGPGRGNIEVRDCHFINHKIPTADGNDTRMLMATSGLLSEAVGLGSGPETRLHNVHFINNTFDAAVASPINDTFGVCQFSGCQNSSMVGNFFLNIPYDKSASIFLYGTSVNCLIANNTFYNTSAIRDIHLQQAYNTRVVGNRCSQSIRVNDCSYTAIVGNKLKNIQIQDADSPSTDPGNESILRGTKHLLIAGNEFNTVDIDVSTPGTDYYAINFDMDNNDANPQHSIAVIGNQAKVKKSFINFTPVHSSSPGPAHDIVISGNHITERSDVDANSGLIRVVGNSLVPSDGINNLYISDNYFGPMMNTGAAGTHRDIDLTTTGMTNVMVKGNWFNNAGVQNANTYSGASRNFGQSASTRDSNFGTGATVPQGSTSVSVTHGVFYTPSLANIQVTPTNNPTNSAAAQFWISNPTSTTFNINTNADPGSGGATFSWQVRRTN